MAGDDVIGVRGVKAVVGEEGEAKKKAVGAKEDDGCDADEDSGEDESHLPWPVARRFLRWRKKAEGSCGEEDRGASSMLIFSCNGWRRRRRRKYFQGNLEDQMLEIRNRRPGCRRERRQEVGTPGGYGRIREEMQEGLFWLLEMDGEMQR